MSLAAGRWESRSGSDARTDRGRLDIGWQPHSWFELRGGWDDIGTAGDSAALHAAFTIPFGGGAWSVPPWEGLGRRDPAPEQSDPGTIWRSVDHVGQIEV